MVLDDSDNASELEIIGGEKIMKYLIDHSKKVIHRTTFAGDECEFHTTPVGKREGTLDSPYLDKLVEEKSYKICMVCSGSMKDE